MLFGSCLSVLGKSFVFKAWKNFTLKLCLSCWFHSLLCVQNQFIYSSVLTLCTFICFNQPHCPQFNSFRPLSFIWDLKRFAPPLVTGWCRPNFVHVFIGNALTEPLSFPNFLYIRNFFYRTLSLTDGQCFKNMLTKEPVHKTEMYPNVRSTGTVLNAVVCVLHKKRTLGYQICTLYCNF